MGKEGIGMGKEGMGMKKQGMGLPVQKVGIQGMGIERMQAMKVGM